MGLNKNKKELLCTYSGYLCGQCKREFNLEGLEVHRINLGVSGGTYELPNVVVLCKACHEIFNSAQRIAVGKQNA